MMKKILAITGGIGSGKSTACSIMSRLGVPVYDSDSRTKSLYSSVPGLLGRISSCLGEDISDGNGNVDRKRLAELIFDDPERLAGVEGIVHPEVIRDFTRWRDSLPDSAPFAVLESATILEKPMFRSLADWVMVVDAPEELRAARAVSRGGISPESISARIKKQKMFAGDFGGKGIPVDYLVRNESTEDELRAKVTAIYEDIVSNKMNFEFQTKTSENED